MKEAIFVRGLDIQKVHRFGREYLKYFSLTDSLVRIDDDDFFSISEKIEEKVVPIIQICNRGRDDVFIAYSREVEEIIGIPIRAIVDEQAFLRGRCQALEREIDRFKKMTIWQRIKRVFKP